MLLPPFDGSRDLRIVDDPLDLVHDAVDEGDAGLAPFRHLFHQILIDLRFQITKGQVVKPDAPNGYKFEKFIFDILPNAKAAAFLAFDQKDEFSPVKNAEGGDSPATCKADMQAKWKKWLAEAGVEVKGDLPIEIDPAYAVDAADLKRWGLCLGAD